MEPIQTAHTFSLIPCGCVVDDVKLQEYLRENRLCQVHGRLIENYISSEVFKQFLERQGDRTAFTAGGRGDELLRKAVKRMRKNNYEKATRTFLKVLEVAPHCVEAKEFIQLLPQGATLPPLLPRSRSPQRSSSPVGKTVPVGLFAKGDDNGYLPIHYAAMHGRVAQVKALAKENPNFIHATNGSGATPLIVAVQHNKIDVVKLLIGLGAKFTTMADGYTPFHSAAHFGHEAIFDLLLEAFKGENLNICSEEGGTPLMLACELDSVDLVKKLVQRGANPAVSRKDGITAIEIALLRRCGPVLEFLVSQTLQSPLSSHTCETAAKEGSREMVDILSRHPSFFAFRNAFEDTLLHIAIRNGNFPVAHFLLDQAPTLIHEKNRAKQTAISLAIGGGFWELIEELVKRGVVLEIEKTLPQLIYSEYHPFLDRLFNQLNLSQEKLNALLKVACEAGQHEVISRILLPKGAQPDCIQGPNGWKLIHYLARSDGIFLFKQFLGQDILQRDSTGKSLLYIAAENGSIRVLQFLLSKLKQLGLSLQNHHKNFHLFYATLESVHLPSITLMLDQFSDLANAILDAKGTRSSHIAARKGSVAVLKILKEKGAKFTEEDAEGNSPLDYAVRAEAKEAVEFLLKTCEVPVTANALYLAASQKDDAIFKLLRSFTKDIEVRDRNGNSALFLSMMVADLKAFKRLAREGISLKLAGQKGWTPLPFAAALGLDEAVDMILKSGVIDRTEVDGNDALHWAVSNGHANCAKMLVRAGFRVDIPNSDKKTALEIAQSRKSVLLSLGGGDEASHRLLTLFLFALGQSDFAKIEQAMLFLPPNEWLSVTHSSRKLWGTPLQLLLHVCHEGKNPDQLVPYHTLIKKMAKNPSLDPNIPDSQGNTLIHLLLRANISLNELDPTVLERANLKLVNHKKATLLHIAARYCSQESLEALYEKMEPEFRNRMDRKGRTAIFYAVEGEKVKNILYLCEKGADLSHQDYRLNTPLLLACMKQNLKLIQTLIERGAPINQRGTIDGLAPLHLSLGKGSDEICFYLLFAGARSDLPSFDGISPIHIAATTGKLPLFRFLAAKGLSLETQDLSGKHPIHFAAASGATEVVATLGQFDPSILDTPIESGEEQIKGATPLFLAASTGHAETASWLLDHGANPESQTSRGMSILSAAGNSRLILELLHQYQLTEKPEFLKTAIVSAIAQDNVETMKTLIQWGIPIHAELINHEMAIHFASRFGAVQCTAFLLENGAAPLQPGFSGETVVELSAANDSLDQFKLIINFLLSNQEDFALDQFFSRGETLFHIAAKSGKLQHLVYLIQLGANLEALDAHHQTALHLAAREGYPAVVALLLAIGADWSVRSSLGKLAKELVREEDSATKRAFEEFEQLQRQARRGESLVHLAVRAHSKLALQILSLSGELDDKDEAGNTALHLAVELEKAELALELMKNNRELVDLQNANKETALFIACFTAKNPRLAKVLVKWGASLNIPDGQGLTISQKVASLPEGQLKQDLTKIFK